MRLIYNTRLKLLLASMIMIAGLYSYAQTDKFTMTVQAVASTTDAKVVSQAPATAAGGMTSAANKPAPNPSPSPSCQPSGYAQPAAPTVSADQPGLHQNILAPSHYTVSGNTASQLGNQLNDCTPVTENGERFAASTDYAINWAFDFLGDGNGTCHVTQASVGINVGIIYPNWQPTAGAAAGLDASWQRFITNLATHENGHVQIDQAGAAQLLSDLQNFPATGCDAIVGQVTAKASADIQGINQANQAYDTRTNHGAHQGATLN
jgi:predicted secreted Zn-dependent protease